MNSHLRSLAALGAAGAVLAPSGGAAAQDDGWSVTVSPYVWTAALDGTSGLGRFETDVDIPFSETLESLDFALFGDVEVRRGRWGLFFDGQYVKTSQDEEIRSRELGLEITKSLVQGAVFYRIYDSPQGGDTATGAPRRFTIDPMVGLRWNSLKANLSAQGQELSRKAEWTEPFVGVRSSWDVGARWNLSGEADVGGFGIDRKKSANAQAFLGYRTYLLQRPSMVRVGYRTFHQEYATGGAGERAFRWDVTQHGPVIGLSMTF